MKIPGVIALLLVIGSFMLSVDLTKKYFTDTRPDVLLEKLREFKNTKEAGASSSVLCEKAIEIQKLALDIKELDKKYISITHDVVSNNCKGDK